MAGLQLLREGQLFAGDFEIKKPLKEGGMGAVYVALQLSTDRLRALKVMQPSLVRDEKARAKFVQEARIASRIHSMHVVEVIAAGIDAETSMPWIAMELLKGEDLADRIAQRGPLEPSELLVVMRQVCHALGSAHVAKPNAIVHRDLKPENLFVGASTSPQFPFVAKILDFGIAKLVHEAGGSSTGSMGSPLWIAPEQTKARTHVTPATDVWALGLIAFFALTRRSYWISGNEEEFNLYAFLGEMVNEPLVPASQRAMELRSKRTLPPGFDAWFARCVHREPEARFRDANECLAALETALESPRAVAATQPMSHPASTPLWAAPTLAANASTQPDGPIATPVAPTAPMMVPTPYATGDLPARRDSTRLVFGAGIAAVAGIVLAVAGAAVISQDDGNVTAAPAAATGAAGTAPIAPTPPPPPPPDPNPFVAIEPPSTDVRLGLSDATMTRGDSRRLTGFRASAGVHAPRERFQIQQHEVTWDELSPFLRASGLERLLPARLDQLAHQPATGVPWAMAQRYCHSLDGDLPTEEQWEYAARSAALRRYPWGSDARAIRPGLHDVTTDEVDRTAGAPESWLYGMLGNGEEWTSQVYRGADGSTPSWARSTTSDRTFYAIRGGLPEGHPEPLAHRERRCQGAECPPDTDQLIATVGFRCVR